MTVKRYTELKQMLEDYRQEAGGEVAEKLRRVRTESSWQRSASLSDAIEAADADVQEDIELIIIRMKAETLEKINEALKRLESGIYGNCSDCGGEISENRLRALPFAIRCTECESAHETAERQRHYPHSRNMGPLFGPAAR